MESEADTEDRKLSPGELELKSARVPWVSSLDLLRKLLTAEDFKKRRIEKARHRFEEEARNKYIFKRDVHLFILTFLVSFRMNKNSEVFLSCREQIINNTCWISSS